MKLPMIFFRSLKRSEPATAAVLQVTKSFSPAWVNLWCNNCWEEQRQIQCNWLSLPFVSEAVLRGAERDCATVQELVADRQGSNWISASDNLNDKQHWSCHCVWTQGPPSQNSPEEIIHLLAGYRWVSFPLNAHFQSSILTARIQWSGVEWSGVEEASAEGSSFNLLVWTHLLGIWTWCSTLSLLYLSKKQNRRQEFRLV